VVADEEDDGAIHGDPRGARGRPGSRAPHYFLTRDGEKVSTIDLIKRDFVLFTGADGAAWAAAADAASRQLGVHVDTHSIGTGEYADPEGGFTDCFGISQTGAVLVRPDGFVAWRAVTDAEASAEVFAAVLAAILDRDSGEQQPAGGVTESAAG
jgi:putative polyketide hydroxylase